MFRQLLNRREIFNMKSKTKKIIAVLSAAAMVLSFGACSKQTASDSTKEVKLWMNSGHSKSFWEEKVKQFNDSQGKDLGVKLVLESKTDSSYDQQLEIALQSGELPEMFFAGYATNIVDKEAVLSFDQLPGMEETIAKYEPYMQENIHKVKGKVYALPFGITTRGLIYNKDMFKAAGIVDENGEAKPPKTYDELRVAAKKLTNKSKNQYGIMFPVKWGAWVESDITSLAYSSSGRDAYDPVSGTYDYSVYEPELALIKGLK
ncbi:MAG: extracellular solute-binding protein, partial [Ruminococcaceae bacterium]|nr:extracellular solute-binding protein [Oscillospiraceae bacterium]